MLIKIKEYKAGKRGERGLAISIPQVYVNDHNIQPSDTLEVYRTVLEGKDVIVLSVKKEPENKAA